MGTPKGAKFTPEHVQKILTARRHSEAWREGRKRAAEKLRGRAPTLDAIVSSLASRALKRLGLDPDESPVLFEAYYQLYLVRIQERRERETVAA